MKQHPQTEVEIQYRQILENNFPDTITESRKVEKVLWKKAIIEYLYHEAKLKKIEISRILCKDHSTILYHLNPILCKRYDRFKPNAFNQFKESLVV